MERFAYATIEELSLSLGKKEVSRKELLSFFLDRFKKHDEKIGSALEVFDADSILKDSMQTGPLAGIPGILKDNICQNNRVVSCASKILESFVSPYDATVCKRLKSDGALLIGRANCDEFAMGSSNETSAFKKTSNPWNLEYVPGGSSGGPAAAVSAGLVPWGLGSDTGGSVRTPASFCGIVGLKPTYGLVSRYGLVAYGSSLDQVGVHTRTVCDNALVLSSIAGEDTCDSTTLDVSKKNYLSSIKNGFEGKKPTIGVLEEWIESDLIDKDVSAAIKESIKTFKSLGFAIKPIKLPALDYAAATYFIVSRAEAASNLARFDGVRYGLRDKDAHELAEVYCNSRRDGFGTEVKCRILVGNYVLSVGHADEFYSNAKKVQQLIRIQFEEIFKDVDIVLSPTQANTAFKFGAYDDNKLQMDLGDAYTCPANLAGVPAISVPCGFDSKGLPVGMQMIGPHLSEQLLYKVAYSYEQETEWHKQHPKGF